MERETSSSSSTAMAQSHFDFFELPAELRIQILELALDPPKSGVPLSNPGLPIPPDAKSIFLVSKQMYADAVSIYYRNVHIDLRDCHFKTSLQKCTRQFLETATVPRQHVKNAIISLNVADCCNLQSIWSLELEKYMQLRKLTVLIGPDYPYPPYGCAEHPPTQPRHFFKSHLNSGDQVTGPQCLQESQFQAFLKFLQKPQRGKVVVMVQRYHLDFLCQFHEPDEGRECRGEWRGPGDWKPLDHRAMVRALLGAEIDRSVPAERSWVRYKQAD